MLVKTKTAIGPSTTKYSKITNNLNEKNYIMTNIRENLSLLKSGLVDRQMAQQLRACSVLAENPSSVPRTHSEQFIALGIPEPSSAPTGFACTCTYTETDMHTHN